MNCKICSNNNTKEVINLKKQPLANKYPRNKKEIIKEPIYDLKVYYCTNCKSAQIGKLINRDLMFKDYYYLSSVNKKLVDHFNNLSKKLIKSKFVIDIGSNDGILIKPLKKAGIKTLGIDPSINVSKIANSKGYKTLVGFFNDKIIDKILKKYPKPDVLVASSVMTHMENPKQFAKNVKKLLEKNGKLILEIEYLYNFIKNLEFERFYFDRPFYYSIKSVDLLFKSVGMSLIDIEKINVHGESLRFVIINKKNQKKSSRLLRLIKIESHNLNLKLFKNFNLKINREGDKFLKYLKKFKQSGKNIIGYGAPARVATITNYLGIDSDLIPSIIDDSPLKQKKFTPGKHIKIVRKKDINLKTIDIVIVFAYEYFVEIKKNFKNIKVMFFKPIPFKKLK